LVLQHNFFHSGYVIKAPQSSSAFYREPAQLSWCQKPT